jgi:cytochrome c oxidase assembly protein subunit 11
MAGPLPTTPAPRRGLGFGVTAAICVAFVAGMVGMSYAAVPLYRIFCQVTGYDGTTRRADAAPATIADRVVTVRFDSNIGNNLGWDFHPVQREVKIRLGEVGQATFRAENKTAQTLTGRAVFNVTPDAVGAYFNKIACFCFTDETLKAGESEDLGVTFFVDPAYADDPELSTITTITLSYTFFPAKGANDNTAAANPATASTASPL